MSQMITKLTPDDVANRARTILRVLTAQHGEGPLRVYPVPRGGVPVALYMAGRFKKIILTDDPERADIAVDDIIDSGATAARMKKDHGLETYALYDKRANDDDKALGWIVFPWETGKSATAHDIVTRQLQFIGEDAKRGGLIETPARVEKAWAEKYSGYAFDTDEKIAAVLKTFDDGASGTDQMVLVSNIPLYSQCEHHMESIFGVAHIGYVPDGKIVGLSKMKRLVDIFARRLQVQERLTTEIADALEKHLQPLGVAVYIRARHMCVESRGVNVPGTVTTTSALRGAIKNEPSARAEFLQLIQLAETKT